MGSRERALLAVVLAGSAAIRLWRWDLAQVGYDESAAASLVAAWQSDRLVPLAGIISSVGIPNPPAWPYLMAPVLLVAHAPQALVAEGIGISLVAVGLTWWIGRRWLGAWGGLAAAAVYGFGFWSTLLGRSPWQPAFLQIPALLCLEALLTLAVARRPWALVVAAGWLGVMVQLHYVAAMYVLLLPLAAWPARRRLRGLHLVAGALAAAVPLVPFLIYELHPEVRLRDLALLASPPGSSGQIDLQAWSLAWTLAGNGGVAGLGGDNADGLREALGRWASLGLIGDLLLAGGLVVGLVRRCTGQSGGPGGEATAGRLIAGWVLLPVVVLARHTFGVLFHYLYIDLPGMALAVGVLAAWVAARPRVARLALAGAIAVYAAVSSVTLVVVLDYVEHVDVHNGYGMPLRFSLAAASAARTAVPPGGQVLLGGKPFDVEVVRFSLGFGVPAQLFDECQSPPWVPNGVYVLLHAQTPAARALQEAGAPLLAQIQRPGDAYAVYGSPTTTMPPTVSGGGCPG